MAVRERVVVPLPRDKSEGGKSYSSFRADLRLSPFLASPSPSGAEEDVFALEQLDGHGERQGGVDAGGDKNRRDVIPVVGAGDNLFAHQAGIHNREQREPGVQLDSR